MGIGDSWTRNAGRWTEAVRGGRIASRAQATDAAIVKAVASRRPRRLLDVGCGEGWLVRAVRARCGCEAVGMDACAPLVAAAGAADPDGRYVVASYDDLVAGRAAVGTGFDAVVFNYALLDAKVVPVLAAARARLAPGGAILIQTLHPWTTADGDYRNGWRTEDFSAFEGEDWAPMPWYFRTLESWVGAFGAAGLRIAALAEPAAGGRPLSLLLTGEA